MGLIILELVANVDLPEYGDMWYLLRTGDFKDVDFNRCSNDLMVLVKHMLSPDPLLRPTAIDILAVLEGEIKMG